MVRSPPVPDLEGGQSQGRQRGASAPVPIPGCRLISSLRGYRRRSDRKLRLSDIEELFEQMRDWRKQKGRLVAFNTDEGWSRDISDDVVMRAGRRVLK
jgi:hypothetical protein